MGKKRSHKDELSYSISANKKLDTAPGLFCFPEDQKADETNRGKRKFVVFYFDSEADYDRVVRALEVKGRGKAAPWMNTDKLLSLLTGVE
jgi:hypothetical protein